ncbi:HTH-type transcriptional repressor [Baekduia alba]|nr:HTH-type transcriptional repressor [Baekduia alba]
MEAIARSAQANKERLYGNFGSKDALFAEVLRGRMGDLAAAVELDPNAVPEYLGRIFDFHAEHPQLIRLLHWEGLQTAPPWAEQNLRTAHYAEKARAVGEGSGDEDPAALLVGLLALATWWFVVPQIVEMTLGEDPATPESRARQRATVVRLAERMVASSRAPSRVSGGLRPGR